jgi:hypothetical protein
MPAVLISDPNSYDGEVSISPFFTCPKKLYPYAFRKFNVSQTIVAETSGFGDPVFTWKIQGITRPSFGSGSAVVPTEIPNPGNPGKPTIDSRTIYFNYSVPFDLSLPLNASELVLNSHTYDGEYVVEVDVEVRERQEVVVNPAAPANTATNHIHFAGMKVEYGGDYYKDGAACKKAFENALDHVPKLEKQIDIIKTLPDPPWGGEIETHFRRGRSNPENCRKRTQS